MKARSFSPLIWFMVCALAIFNARAGLVLTNYTAANPLKVLPIGDSITDDSVTNGAWRVFLEPLLVANGYNFINVGRWTSTPHTGFTRVNHEGMDGSVIAAPGVSGPTHGYALTDNYSLLTVSDAFTYLSNVGTLPDLVIIDMGVNDMGRGRDPNDTATNALSSLLDLVFSNAPSANIIVCKPTTITYATILGYSSYWQNMHTYGSAIQQLAAARRAMGQKVYVADLFSAVYGSGLFQTSDYLHPNAVGRSDIAKELMFRINSITTQPYAATTPFIVGGSVWKYSDKGTNYGTNWSQPGFDDSTWSQGPARLGYNIPGITTGIGFGTNYLQKNITTYFRQKFVVPAGFAYTNLNVRLDRVDGAVVYLNGQELFRMNMPAGTVTYATTASSQVNESGDDINTYFPTNVAIGSLHSGTNVLAVEIHKNSGSVSGLAFDLELFGQGYPLPNLSHTGTAGASKVVWPTNYSTFRLQSSTNLASTNEWTNISGPYPQSNSLYQVSVSNTSSAQFYRLIKP